MDFLVIDTNMMFPELHSLLEWFRPHQHCPHQDSVRAHVSLTAQVPLYEDFRSHKLMRSILCQSVMHSFSFLISNKPKFVTSTHLFSPRSMFFGFKSQCATSYQSNNLIALEPSYRIISFCTRPKSAAKLD